MLLHPSDLQVFTVNKGIKEHSHAAPEILGPLSCSPIAPPDAGLWGAWCSKRSQSGESFVHFSLIGHSSLLSALMESGDNVLHVRNHPDEPQGTPGS